MSRLLLMRHGSTEWNERGAMQGRADPPLSSAGRVQVGRWRIPEGDIPGLWMASPLRRAMETARLLGVEAVAEPRLLELEWGDWEGRSLTELRADPAADMARREAMGLDFQPPGGESYRMLQDRLMPLLFELRAEDGLVGAICHKGVMLALLAKATGWDMTGPPPTKLLSDCCHIFRIDPEGRPTVDRLNLTLLP